jgi:16S rRNA G527 N7-methylase RsmG
MFEAEAKKLLKSSLGFSDIDIDKLEKFKTFLLEYNAKYNLISKSTENTI